MSMNEEMKKKIKLIVICIIIGSVLGVLLSGELEIESPTNQYRKMKKIDSSQTIIGLSKEEVKEILGEPVEIYTYNEETYMYNAGYIYYYGLFYSQRHTYVLYVKFTEMGIVKSTIIKERP